MNDDLGVLYELDQVVDDVTELRLVFEKLPVDAVHRERAFVAVALGIDVLMKATLGNSAADDFDRTDLDDAMPILDFEPGGLGIEYDLSRRHAGAFTRRRSPPSAGCAC